MVSIVVSCCALVYRFYFGLLTQERSTAVHGVSSVFLTFMHMSTLWASFKQLFTVLYRICYITKTIVNDANRCTGCIFVDLKKKKCNLLNPLWISNKQKRQPAPILSVRYSLSEAASVSKGGQCSIYLLAQTLMEFCLPHLELSKQGDNGWIHATHLSIEKMPRCYTGLCLFQGLQSYL